MTLKRVQEISMDFIFAVPFLWMEAGSVFEAFADCLLEICASNWIMTFS
jgi:hypothetical protein